MKELFNNFKTKTKIQKVSLIMAIIGITLLITGVSFAFFNANFLGIRENKLTIGKNLVFRYDETGTALSLSNDDILSDEDGKNQSKYFDFEVSQQTEVETTTNYYIYLTKDESSNLSDEKVKIYLTDQSDSSLLGITTINNLEKHANYDASYYLYETSITTNGTTQTDKYRLRVWIDDNLSATITEEDGVHTLERMNYTYKFKINVATGIIPLDTSGANEPVLATNMIPVYYDSNEAVWKKSKADNSGVEATCLLGDANGDGKLNTKDVTYTNWYLTDYLNDPNGIYRVSVCSDVTGDGIVTVEDVDLIRNYLKTPSSNPLPAGEPLEEKTYLIPWYDYNAKQWANAVTVTEVNGSRNDLVDAAPGTPIPMERINTMLVWIPRFSATGDTSNYNGGTIDAPGAFNITFVNKETSAHDAFDFGGAVSGFWMGKFENSSDTECTPASYSEVGVGCNLNTIRPKILPNVTSWRGASVSTFFGDMQKMTDSGNQYGFDKTIDTTLDTHMLKNNEWGAVAYLTQSIYGRCTSSTSCTEVGINNNSSYITGYGAPVGSSSTVANGTYETSLGMDASTTGNIYGVYDMSGGAFEYVMGNYNNTISGDQFTTLPNIKYYNVYTAESAYTTSGLQHALIETKNWYGDNSNFVNSLSPWFFRGGGYNFSYYAGVFLFNSNTSDSGASLGCRLSVTIN